LFRISTILSEKYKDANKFYVLRMDEKLKTQQSDIKYLINWLQSCEGESGLPETKIVRTPKRPKREGEQEAEQKRGRKRRFNSNAPTCLWMTPKSYPGDESEKSQLERELRYCKPDPKARVNVYLPLLCKSAT